MGAYLGNNKKLKIMLNNVAFKIQPGKLTKCDHKYTSTVVVPTCTVQGYTKHTCSLCGNTYNDSYVAKLDHVVITIPGYDATTQAPGLTDGQKCNVCGTILKEQEIIPIIPTPGEEECTHTIVYRTENRIEATCTENGSYERIEYCTVCNEELSRETIEIKATRHNWGELITDVPATETAQGSGHRDCLNNCGEQQLETIPELGHTHTEETLEAIPATCTSTGLTEGKKCSTCGEILVAQETIDIDPDNHTGEIVDGGIAESHLEYSCCRKVTSTAHKYDQDSGVEYKAATCTTNRKNYLECACGHNPQLIAYVTEVENSKLPHTPGAAATCTEPQKCTVCHETLVAAPGHSTYTEIENKVDATCTETGSYDEVTYCHNCNEELDRTSHVLPALDHTDSKDSNNLCDRCGTPMCTDDSHISEIIPAKAATCNSTGLTEGAKCSACGKILIAQEETPVLDHDYKLTTEWTGSDDSEGCILTATRKCSLCEDQMTQTITPDTYKGASATCMETGWYECYTYIDGEQHTCPYSHTIPKTEHTVVDDMGVAPTCEETGLTEGSHCSVCNTVLVAQTELPANGHSYIKVVTPPTCVDQGYTTTTCEYCEYYDESNYTDPLGEDGHDFYDSDTRYNYQASTCTTDERYDIKCNNCDALQEVVVADTALGHDFEHDDWQVIKAPTCTESGEYHLYCLNGCGEYQANYPEATGHSYGNWIIDSAANCGYDGERHRECSACGDTEIETIDAYGDHEYDENTLDVKTPATCTTEGIGVAECIVCQNSYKTVSIPALEHLYDEDDDSSWVVENAATCTESGTIVKTCQRCGDVVSRNETDPLGHSYEYGDIVYPTCTTDGHEADATCTRCNHVIYGRTHEKLGHQAGTAVTENEVAATCKAAGSYDEVVYCTRWTENQQECGEELSRETITIPKTGHTGGSYVKEIIDTAYCTVQGSYTEAQYCTECNTELDRTEVSYYNDPDNHPVDMVNGCNCEECGKDWHIWTTKEVKEPTCEEDGFTLLECSTCHAQSRTTNKAPGHVKGSPSYEESKEHPGSVCFTDTVIRCVVCNEELSRTTDESHSFDEMTPCTCMDCNEYHDDSYLDSHCHCTECGEDFHDRPVYACTCTRCGHDNSYVDTETFICSECSIAFDDLE